jgi:hypothetical protein
MPFGKSVKIPQPAAGRCNTGDSGEHKAFDHLRHNGATSFFAMPSVTICRFYIYFASDFQSRAWH